MRHPFLPIPLAGSSSNAFLIRSSAVELDDLEPPSATGCSRLDDVADAPPEQRTTDRGLVGDLASERVALARADDAVIDRAAALKVEHRHTLPELNLAVVPRSDDFSTSEALIEKGQASVEQRELMPRVQVVAVLRRCIARLEGRPHPLEERLALGAEPRVLGLQLLEP